MTNNDQTEAERAAAITYAICIQLLRFAMLIGAGIFFLFVVLPFVIFTVLPIAFWFGAFGVCKLLGQC